MAAAEIDRLAGGALRVENRDQAVDGVLHEVEIARRRERAQLDLGLAGGDLADDRRNHGARRLPGAVGVEGSRHRDRHSEGAIVRERDLIRADLARGVRRLADERMLFGDRHELRGAVAFGGRGVHDLGGAEVLRGRDDVQRAGDVDVHIGLRRDVGIRDRDQRREMHHGVLALHRRPHEAVVADVARHHLDGIADLARAVVEPAPRIERVVEHHRAHVEAPPHQRFSEVRADETVGAGDEHILHRR